MTTEITYDEAMTRLKGVLKANFIKLKVGGCSCCGVFEVEFPDGATFEDVSFYFDTEKDDLPNSEG